MFNNIPVTDIAIITLERLLSPVHTGDKVDRIGDCQQSRLCCRFVASSGNSRLCRQLSPVCTGL